MTLTLQRQSPVPSVSHPPSLKVQWEMVSETLIPPIFLHLAFVPDQNTVNKMDLLILRQAMPLGNLATRMVTNLPPVLARGACRWCAQHQAPENSVGGAWVAWIRVHQQQLHTGVPQALVRGQIKHKELIEDWVGGALLYVGLLFAHTLLSMVHVYLDIWI